MQKFNPFGTYKKGEQFEINGEIYEALMDLKPCGTPPFLHIRSANWNDQLDGTWENGVWCMCDGEKAMKVIERGFEGEFYVDEDTWFDDVNPLPQDLAEQLEALSNKSLT